ncbi:MAG: M48 family metallopeptidase [Marinovum sp.]|nr:M48 family metallopeptidase [Marinovum sp.]
MRGRGRFFDGLTAAQHEVAVTLTEDGLAVKIEGPSLKAPLHWPLGDLRATQDHADPYQMILTRKAETEDESPRDPARLVIDDAEMIAWLKDSRPDLYRADVRSGTGKKILRNTGLALGAVALMLFVILPAMANTLARIIPLEREVAFGKSITGQMERFLGGTEIGDLHCNAPEGVAALQAMTATLTDGEDIGYDLNVLVFDHSMTNAFAAPGGQVVLLRGLLEDAPGPDAVAGVLAHEIAHVVYRDPTRVALRTVGSAGLLSLLIGDVTGGAVMVLLAEQVLNSSYSRDAETQADTYAIDALTRVGVSTDGFAQFFDLIKELQGDISIPEILASHPDTDGRSARSAENAATQSNTRQIITDAQWVALQSICDGRG